MKRIPELDGVRGCAILSVLALHLFFVQFAAPAGLHWLWTLGALSWGGVDLFFVLSGFLIGGILLDARDAPRYFQVFYFRRLCRIVPPYAAVGLLACVLALFVSAARPLVGLTFPWWSYATFTQNLFMARTETFGPVFFAVTWSLAIEEQFYITLPLVIRFCSRRTLHGLLAAAIVGAPILRLVLHLKGGVVAPYVLMPARADALSLGVVTALLVRSPAAFAWLSARHRAISATLTVCAGALTALAFWNGSYSSLSMVLVGYSLLAFASALVILSAVTHSDGWLAAALRWRPLRALGGIAYTVYLLHLGVLWIGLTMFPESHGHPLLRHGVITGLALAVTLWVAEISWKWFESPIVRWGHQLDYKPARDVAVSGVSLAASVAP